MSTITSNLSDAIAELNGVMDVYAQVSRRAPVEIATRKAQQILLGIGNERRGERHFPGLFERLADTAPAKGRITAERRAAGWRVGGRADSTSLSLARARADALLAGATSAAFRINYGSAGEIDYIAGVAVGKVQVRGRRKGQVTFGSRSKTALPATGGRGGRVTRAAARAAGGRLLNRQALIAVLTIARREHSRLATAVQFLPHRYRTVLRRRPEFQYRRGQAVGINSTDAAQAHVHERVLITNRKGSTLGGLTLDGGPGSAALSIRGEFGLHTPGQFAAAQESIAQVTADTMAYVVRKTNEALARAA